MRKLDYENTPSIAVDPAEDATFSAVGDAVKARPAEFVRALGERLYLIGSSIQLFSDPHARADLLAIDTQGRAVVVVIERPGEHSLLERGLMCAGLVAGWKPEFFFRYPTAGVAAKLRAFLSVPDEQVNRAQRVVLVAHSHEYAIFSASQWLAQQHGIEIWCVQGRLQPESGRLELVRLEPESFRPGEPVETVRVVFPQPSGELAERTVRLDASVPVEPALSPLTGAVTGACRLRTIWRPAPAEPAPDAGGPEEKPAGEEPPAPVQDHAGQIVAEQPPPVARQPVERTPDQAPAAPKPPPGKETAAKPAVPARPRRPFRIVGLMTLVAGLAVAGMLVLSLPNQPVLDEASLLVEPRLPAPPPLAPAPVPADPSKPRGTAQFSGTVHDRVTGRPVPGARLYYDGKSTRAGTAGEFKIAARPQERRLLVKASGYRQTSASLDAPQPILLDPLDVRGYYVSPSQMADPAGRENIVELIRGTAANAVVLSVKDVTGQISVLVDHALARETQSARRATRTDLARQVSAWKKDGIYTIALVALFKDDLLARTKTDLALRSVTSRQPIIDADGIAWADPAAARVRGYNLAVAEAAAVAGFDEIHFDFIRYPSEGLSREGGGSSEYQRRLGTLVDFLTDADKLLAPYNVYVSASVFGSVCIMPRASVIGQKIEEFAEHVDYVAPMLYPSYFEPGKRFPIPLRHAYQLVHESLLRAARRLEGQSLKLRPWLQNFPDRASPNVPLHAHSIFGQVKAAEDAQTSGWMLWDARGLYRNTAEAIAMLEDERGNAQRPASDSGGDGSGDGGTIVPVIDTFGGGPPTPSAGERFRLVAVLVMTGLCLAVLYGAVRAAWLFRQWNRTGPPAQLPQEQAAPVARKWLTRPQFLRSLPHARPR